MLRVLIMFSNDGMGHAFDASDDSRLKKVLQSIIAEQIDLGKLNHIKEDAIRLSESGTIGDMCDVIEEGGLMIGRGQAEIVNVSPVWKKGLLS